MTPIFMPQMAIGPGADFEDFLIFLAVMVVIMLSIPFLARGFVRYAEAVDNWLDRRSRKGPGAGR